MVILVSNGFVGFVGFINLVIGFLIIFIKVKVRGYLGYVVIYVFLDSGFNLIFCIEEFFK